MSVSRSQQTSVVRQAATATRSGLEYYEAVERFSAEVSRLWDDRVAPLREDFATTVFGLREVCDTIADEIDMKIALERTSPSVNLDRLRLLRELYDRWSALSASLPSPDEDGYEVKVPGVVPVMEVLATVERMPFTIETLTEQALEGLNPDAKGDGSDGNK